MERDAFSRPQSQGLRDEFESGYRQARARQGKRVLAVFVSVLSAIIFSLQTLVYPTALGRALPIDSVMTGGAMAGAYLAISIAGGALLAVMLGIYVHVAGRGRSSLPA